MKRITPLLLLALTLAGLSPALLPAASAQQLPVYSSNFDTDTVGSPPSGAWSDVSGTVETVRAGSPLSAPNWYSNNTATFGVGYGNVSNIYSAGTVQFSYVVRGTYNVLKSEFSFVTGTYVPLISGANIGWYNTKTGALVSGSVPLPAFFVDGAAVTQKAEYDPSTTGGPTMRLKIWQYGQSEPTAWTQVVQETTAANVPAGGFSVYMHNRNTGASTVALGIDDYFEGPVGSTFTNAPATQVIAPNNAAIIYDKGTFALSATNATCADAGAKISVPFTGSQLALITNEGDGSQWIRYHVVTPGATAAQGAVPPWQTINLPAGTATTLLDSADADPTLQHTCYISFYRHGYSDIYGSSTVAIPVNALNITGYRIDASAALGTALAPNGFTDYAILMGDSIPEGYSSDPATGQSDATWNWVEGVFRGLKCNGSRFVHGGQGYRQAGGGGVPAFNTAYSTLFYGQSRLNAQGKLGFVPKYAILEHGVNGPAPTQADITTALTNIRAMTDPSTMIVQLLPLGGQSGTAATAGNIASFVASYKSATGDQNVVVADTSPYGISLALTNSTGVPGFRGSDTLHPNNNQSGEIVGAVLGAIRDVTTASAAGAAYRGQIRRGR